MDYDRCPCTGTYERRRVEVRMNTAGDEPLVLDQVPQGLCPLCGSRVYKVQVLDLLETCMRVASSTSTDTSAARAGTTG